WAITLKGFDELRGRIDLWPFDGKNRDMRGFWLDPELHGRGLMTEAANAVTAFAFEELSWPFLYLTNAVTNRASARVKEKQGAVEIAREPFAYVSARRAAPNLAAPTRGLARARRPRHTALRTGSWLRGVRSCDGLNPSSL